MIINHELINQFRSTQGKFNLFDESLDKTESTIELYIRISYLGKCIITEIHSPMSIEKAFYAREETDEHYRYQFRELNTMDLESFCWGSLTIIPPLHPDNLICRCERVEKAVEEATQTKKKKKRKRDELDFYGKMARAQELLAKMKEMRKNRPDSIAHGVAKKVCPPPVCPTVCTPVCVYTLPSICPSPCQPSTVYCMPSLASPCTPSCR